LDQQVILMMLKKYFFICKTKKKKKCTDDGLAFDRYFTLVDAKGTFLSQKQHPKLSLVKPQLDASTLTLLLTAPHMPTIELNLNDIVEHQNENSGSIVVCGKKKNKTKNEKKKRQK